MNILTALYDRASPFYDKSNNKVFVFYNDEREEEKHRAMGIQRALSKNLRHEMYRQKLKQPVQNIFPNQRIGSKLHQLYSIEVDFRITQKK